MLWKWEVKFGKSTGNFITHFKRSHSALGADALNVERKAGGHLVDDDEIAGQQRLDVMMQVRICSSQAFYRCLDSLPCKWFDIDELHCCIVQWMVMSNQPWTEIEDPYFQDILTFLRPSLNPTKLLKQKAIREMVNSEAKSARVSLRLYLKVSTCLHSRVHL